MLFLHAILLSLPCLTSAATIEKRDADFESVRTRTKKYMGGKGGDPADKYFHESIFHPHYDGRFAEDTLDYDERKRALANLVQTYLTTFSDIGVETWLMHGTLLGWWWNKKILPWDSDIDVQVSEASMTFLANYYNMTVFHYNTPRIPEGRQYMLEINPHYTIRGMDDKLNVIDGRWVDMYSGLFIDITTARKQDTPEGSEKNVILYNKDGHKYKEKDIFPLRDTFFEGAPAKIPYSYVEVLQSEYRKKAMTLKTYENHNFDDEKLEWLPIVDSENQTPLNGVPAKQP